MFDTVVLMAQLLMVTSVAAWLTLGVWDNILHPSNNEAITAEVMEMSRMRDAFPDAYARVAHRAVTSRGRQKAAFRLVVAVECAALVTLWAGVVCLALALVQIVPLDVAKSLALLGVTLFTAVWAGFLVIGNYFCYWFCHEWAQNTHFQMTFWGIGTMILLVAG